MGNSTRMTKYDDDLPADEVAANREIANDCAAVGFDVPTPWMYSSRDLPKPSDSKLLKILASHLDKHHPRKTIDGLLVALSTPDARPFAFDQVLGILYREKDNYVGQMAINTLSEMVNFSDRELIERILADENLEARSLLFRAYLKLFKHDTVPFLRKLLKSPDKGVLIESLRGLGKFYDIHSRGDFVRESKNPDTDIRRAAREALKKLDRKLLVQ